MYIVFEDLVYWCNFGLVVVLDIKFDSYGVYFGLVKVFGDWFFLMYIGNYCDVDWNWIFYQVGVWMDKDGQVIKLDYEFFVNLFYFIEFCDFQFLVKDGYYYVFLGV